MSKTSQGVGLVGELDYITAGFGLCQKVREEDHFLPVP